MKKTNKIIAFLKNWTLVVCMAFGAIGYYILKCTPALAPLRHPASVVSHIMVPILIFLMLFFTFVKIDFRSYRFARWHVVLALIQTFVSAIIAIVIAKNPDWAGCTLAEGIFCCVVVPSATAAAVIVKKLDGCVQTITTYTLLSGFVGASTIPLLIPLMEPEQHLNFWPFFLLILRRVSPTLIGPFLLAVFVRELVPKLATFIAEKSKDVAFYLWGVNLVILIAQTINSGYKSNVTALMAGILAMTGLMVCVVQFVVGKRIGAYFGDEIACGQGFAQKNTSIAVWLSLSYFIPMSTIVPGSYILWQNVFNSWQLWQKQKKENKP